ncbi:MAG: cache domain-containing protein, partial [Halomonas sp.]|nr:cache domain-containing protein [Halomonas sp.]
MSIRSRLVWLVIAIIAPAMAFALFGTYSVYRTQSEKIDQGMTEVARAIALAVDRELDRYAAIVTTLAASPTLLEGDLRSYHRRLQQTRRALGANVTIFDPNGRPLADTQFPYGTALPRSPVFETFRNGASLDVSHSFDDPATGQRSFAIRRPAVRNGKIAYYLTMTFPVSAIGSVLDQQALPDSWIGVILDRQRTLVARTRDDHMHVGEQASTDFVDQLRRSDGVDGKVLSVTRDNLKVTTFFSHADDSGWVALVGIPRNDLVATAIAPLGAAALGILLVLAIAIAMAIAVGRTITRPLAQLDEAASALARGEVFEPPVTGIDETDRTARVMADASVRIHRSSQEMADRVRDAVIQAERSHLALLQGQ